MAGRSRALAGVAFVVSLGLAGGAAYALDQATSESGEPTALPSATPSPSVSPTASPTPSPTPSATPSPTASPTPSPTPSATPSPTASPTPRVTASPTKATTYPYPKPTVVYSGLEVEAGFNRTTGTPSTVFRLTVRASDGDGKVYVASIDWEGDGQLDVVYPNPASCKSYPPLTSPPGPYQPAPSSQTFTYEHTYPAGFFQPVVVTRSVNATCKPNGPKVESSTVRFDDGITVADPQP